MLERSRARSLGRARQAAVLVVVAAVAGCGGGASLSLDDLSRGRSTCPVDLAGAARSAGLQTRGQVTGRSSGSAPAPGARSDGVVSQCHVGVAGGGGLSLLLVATKDRSAMAVLLPDIVDRAKLPPSDYAPLLARAEKTSAGHLVGLPGAEPVAVLVVPIDDGNAAAGLSGDDGPDRAKVEAVAEALGAALS